MPPLKVIDYIFPEIECKANPNCPVDLNDCDEPAVNVGLRMAVKEDDPSVHRLTLDIEFGSLEQKCAYYGRVKVVGVFLVRGEHASLEDVVRVNGASMLYTAAREFVLALTSRGPNPPLMLPTVRFYPQSVGADVNS